MMDVALTIEYMKITGENAQHVVVDFQLILTFVF